MSNEFILFDEQLININFIKIIRTSSPKNIGNFHVVVIISCAQQANGFDTIMEKFETKEVMDARLNEIKSMLNIIKPGCALGELIEGLGHS